MNFDQLKQTLSHLPSDRLVESNWHQYKNPNGLTGGWVENSASVEDTVYIGPSAVVYDNARVYGNALIYGNARVYGNAQVYGNAEVCGDAWVFECAQVYGDTEVYGDTRIHGNAQIFSVYVDCDISGEQDIEKTSLDFNQYQKQALSTAIYPENMAIQYCAMKLGGEAGECLEKIAKTYRDNEGIFSDEKKKAIAKELGDILWYIANLAFLFDYTFEQVASMNLNKLADRQKRGTLSGSGDNR
jgi:NTP pyrophosphatase (non-canonical NTP hydrolase)